MDLYAYIQKDEELINKYIDEHYDGQNIPRYRGDLLDVKWDIIKEADRKAQDLRYTMTYSFIQYSKNTCDFSHGMNCKNLLTFLVSYGIIKVTINWR